MATYILGAGSCDPKLARLTITDYLEAGNEPIAVTSDAGWLFPIARDLEITTREDLPEFGTTDTVIAPMDTEGLEDILKAGAVVLDLSDGLLPLELTDEPQEVPEVPDVPDVLPEASVAEEVPEPAKKKAPAKRAPRSRKKPELDPLPPEANAVEPEAETVEEPVVTLTPIHEKFAEPAPTRAVGIRDNIITTSGIGTSSVAFSQSVSRSETDLLRALVEKKLDSAELTTLYKVLDLLRGA